MFLRYLILACILGYVVTESVYHASENNSDPPFNELSCMVIGGTCSVRGKCPQGTRVTIDGLCPYQEPRGIQCCHSSKAKLIPNRTCIARGGECMAAGVRCPDILTVRGATDCQPDETCCVLV